jgi:capsular polysaccharide biosynthesis protein
VSHFVRRLRGELRDAAKDALGPASRLAGLHLLSKEETETFLDAHSVCSSQRIRTMAVGQSNVNRLDVLGSGLVKVNGRVVLDADYGNRAALRSLGTRTHQQDSILALWSHYWTGYYHWVIDILPKLCAFQDFFGPSLLGRLLCYPTFREKFEVEYLDLLEIPPEKVLDTRITGRLAVQEVSLCTVPKWYSSPPPGVTHVRERLKDAGTTSADGGARIYVGRRGRRMVANEQSLVDMLKTHGFSIIEDRQRSVREQIGIFRDASLVVGPHGAALANLIWCAPGASLVELVPAAYWNQSYRNLCSAMGLRYHSLVETSDVKGHWTNTADDFNVDIPALDAILTTIDTK